MRMLELSNGGELSALWRKCIDFRLVLGMTRRRFLFPRKIWYIQWIFAHFGWINWVRHMNQFAALRKLLVLTWLVQANSIAVNRFKASFLCSPKLSATISFNPKLMISNANPKNKKQQNIMRYIRVRKYLGGPIYPETTYYKPPLILVTIFKRIIRSMLNLKLEVVLVKTT